MEDSKREQDRYILLDSEEEPNLVGGNLRGANFDGANLGGGNPGGGKLGGGNFVGGNLGAVNPGGGGGFHQRFGGASKGAAAVVQYHPNDSFVSFPDPVLEFTSTDSVFNSTANSDLRDENSRDGLAMQNFDGRQKFNSAKFWTPHVAMAQIKSRCNQAGIRSFVAAICLLITVHGTMSTGYLMSVITTIEKRFEIPSKTSGFVISSYEFGSLLSVLFVSYYGSQRHIPRWIGVGALMLSIGAFAFSLPHFLAETYIPDGFQGINATTGRNSKYSMCTPGLGNQSLAKVWKDCEAEEEKLHASSYVFVMVLAQVLIGVGGTPIFTLGTAYIDNHVKQDDASVYLACMYVMVAFGPVCGFLLGGFMLSQYVNSNFLPEELTSGSSAWVGRWWGGFLICGSLYFFAALPFFCFPRILHSSSGEMNDLRIVQQQPDPVTISSPTEERASTPSAPSEISSDFGKSWRNIPNAIARLLRNSVYMVASLGACVDLSIVSGFTVFLPKYLENQFHVSKSYASVLTGAVAVPGACFGIFLGGWLMKKMKLQLQGASGMIVIANFATLLAFTFAFFLGCNNWKVAGATWPYHTPFDASADIDVKLDDQCNTGCACSLTDIQYVCGADGITYLSPCFAGCTAYSVVPILKSQEISSAGPKFSLNFTHCTCVPKNISNQQFNAFNSNSNSTMAPAIFGAESAALRNFFAEPVVKEGACNSFTCKMLPPFMLLLFGLVFIASTTQMPLVMITLRSVAEEEKAFALGLQVVLLRLLAYIPSPIFFGWVIDTTCLVWKEVCGQASSSCLLYDIENFRFRYASIAMALKVISCSLSVGLWFCIKKRHIPFSPPITMSEVARRLGSMDNLHIRDMKLLRSWVSDESLFKSRPKSPRHRKMQSC